MTALSAREVREAAALVRERRAATDRALKRRGLAVLAVGLSFALALLLAWAGGWRMEESRLQLLVVTGAASFAAMLVWALAPSRRQLLSEKSALAPLVLEALGDFDYAPGGRIAEDMLARSRLFGRWSDYSGGDLVRGEHEGLPFGYARAALTRGGPAKLESLVTSGKVKEVFRGAVLAVEGLPPAAGAAFAVTDRGRAMDWLADLSAGMPELRRRESGALEVWAASPEDAGRLARAELAEALAALCKAADARSAELGLHGTAALVKLHTRRPILPGIAEDPVDEARDLHREMKAALALVAALARA
ncbi:MAG: hypothetical protein OXH14_14210 [Alphaproteobacteria bacterium]|nr:hypothetical protein [Alphaproteobacteria bacterium]